MTTEKHVAATVRYTQVVRGVLVEVRVGADYYAATATSKKSAQQKAEAFIREKTGRRA